MICPAIWYYSNVRELRIARSLIAVVCVALLLLCAALGPSVTHVDLTIPTLVFCFLIVFVLSLLWVSGDSRAVPPVPFLSILTSRAPPLA